jgi:hypothetical protein
MKESDIADFYQHKEQKRREAAQRPVSEKLAIASRLREVQEKLAPIRAANKAKQAQRKVRIVVKPDRD